MNRTVSTLLVAALVMLAGCAGSIGGLGASGAQSADSGTVQFYVSDERNAIDQFEHLNVTITKVGFAQADADANASGNWTVESESEGDLELSIDGNVTAGENVTVTVSQNGSAVANATVVVEAGDTETTVTTDAEGTATVAVPDGAEEVSVSASTSEESAYGEAEASLEYEYEAESDDGKDTEWVEREVDSRTVDLTELQGANATALGNVTVPEGEYTKVFVYVSDVNGTLKTGADVNVKLPSQKLHLNKNFEVSSEDSPKFVFDITVFEAGQSGKYILKPVASESGTDVPIVEVGDDDEDDELDVSVVGNVTAGENATVKVTRDGEAVENASITVDGEVVATTDADGTATVTLPEHGEYELAVEATGSDDEEFEGELEFELGDAESGDADSDQSNDADSNDSDQSDADDSQANAEADLAVALDGSLSADETVTITVTDGDGEPVQNATVEVDGDVVGQTNAQGELTFDTPADASMGSHITVIADGETITVGVATVAVAN